MFRKSYGEVFDGDERWNSLEVPTGERFALGLARLDLRAAARRSSRACRAEPSPPADIEGARVLAVLGDSVTTDHISPAGSIKRDGPPGATCRSRASARPTSTPTARGGATTR
jgi:aconitate hydratase